jgi:hypothetical protein
MAERVIALHTNLAAKYTLIAAYKIVTVVSSAPGS